MTDSHRPDADALARLERRRSVPFTAMTEPGPSAAELRRMLAIALRVPDHAVLEPWRLIVFEGEARAEASRRLGELFLRAEEPPMEPARREKFAGIISRVFTHAPVVVVVVSRPVAGTNIPAFEQELSAGAVCMNLLHAAEASGYAATWVTGWAATAPQALEVLGLDAGEKVAGIVHIGTAKEQPPERKRPDLDALLSFWRA